MKRLDSQAMNLGYLQALLHLLTKDQRDSLVNPGTSTLTYEGMMVLSTFWDLMECYIDQNTDWLAEFDYLAAKHNKLREKLKEEGA